MNREIALELADWLAMVRKGNEACYGKNDPIIRDLVAKLVLWENMVREAGEY